MEFFSWRLRDLSSIASVHSNYSSLGTLGMCSWSGGHRDFTLRPGGRNKLDGQQRSPMFFGCGRAISSCLTPRLMGSGFLFLSLVLVLRQVSWNALWMLRFLEPDGWCRW